MNHSPAVDAARLWSRLMDMSEVGATAGGGSNRQALSDADARGRELFIAWARGAGCTISLDSVGNLFARREGTDPDALPVVLGSHLDTQPTGGRFDGVLGVLGALEAVESLNDAELHTNAPIEVAVWTNEEGSRFPVSMMGSAVWAGVIGLDEARALNDKDGISVGDELDRLAWVGNQGLARPMAHYLELHIEQGPVLEQAGATIGVVTAVQGFRWFTVTLDGTPAHAGSTPMDRRRDPSRPLTAILAGIYEIAASHGPQARATPAQFSSEPVSPNTVPARIRFTVDLRHPEADVLESMDESMRRRIAEAAKEHGCEWSIHVDNDSPPVVFDEGCVAAVTASAEASDQKWLPIVSGAGHDACHVAGRVPTSMIFVPCRDGLSHNEQESIEPEAAGHGAAVLLDTAIRLAGL